MNMHCTTVVGLDVHKESIVAAVLEPNADHPSEIIRFENRPDAIKKFVQRIAKKGALNFVYEAGPCGYEAHRQILALGHPCAVIAPGLIPVRPGDRVKTDRRDAKKLARFYRSGELTEIHVPTREQESARDLVRVREDILVDRLRARNRLLKFLLRQGRVYGGKTNWTLEHRVWLRAQQFEFEALEKSFHSYMCAVCDIDERMRVVDEQLLDLADSKAFRVPVQYLCSLKGVQKLSALTLIVETRDFNRFPDARSFMGYTGGTPSEHSSGGKINRGSITKVGNAHLRRILVEAAWTYMRRNATSTVLTKRRAGCPQEVVIIAKKAQTRLHRTFSRMLARGKLKQIAAVAVARELAGFVWSISRHFPESHPA